MPPGELTQTLTPNPEHPTPAMPSSIQRIGVLTAGGDCPGLNAVIRAVTKTAIFQYGLEVVGIEDGFLGIVENRMRPLDSTAVSNILTVGGTILGSSNRCDPTRYCLRGETEPRNHMDLAMGHLRQRGIDALVVIGGDGSMAGAANFVKAGMNCVGVPKTIDNDLEGTEMTFGFPTARWIATEALDRIHTTAASHHRAMVVEVMGRNAGWIALHAGVASGSDVILLPEMPFKLDRVCDKVLERSRVGKRFTIICVSEGAKPVGGQKVVAHYDPTSPDPVRLGGVGQVLARQIEDCTGIESRATVLGHVQRGGPPTATDRVLATEFGYTAMKLLMSGSSNRLVVMQKGVVTDIDLMTAAGRQRLVPPDHPLIAAARAIGTSFGD